MAIQLRRGNETDLDISQFKPGEVAVCLDSGKMIVKLSGGNYLTLTDTDAIQEIVAGKAAASHTHVKSDVTDLTNVKPDWNAASGSDAEILNKPDLSIYAPATFDLVADAHMSYNGFTSNGTTYPNTYTLLKNANDYKFFIIRSYGSTAGGNLWEYITVPSPKTTTVNILLRRVDISGTTLTEYIFGLQFSADGTTIKITYGPNDVVAHIAIWGIK